MTGTELARKAAEPRNKYTSFLIFGVIFLVPGVALSLYNSEPMMGSALVVLGVIFTLAGLIGTLSKKLKRV